MDEPLPLWRVLLAELKRVRPGGAGLDDPRFDDTAAPNSQCLPILFGHVHSWSTAAAGDPVKANAGAAGEAGARSPLTALCFSGGGIRSATFNLGVLQGLAKLGLLGRFDFLSSVSGGGYISGWLARWLHAAGSGPHGLQAVSEALAPGAPRNPECPEPKEVRHLRQYSNYLTPRLGALSADTWTLAESAPRRGVR